MNGILHIDWYPLRILKTPGAKSERSKFGQKSIFSIFGRPNLAKKQGFHQYMLLTPLWVIDVGILGLSYLQGILFGSTILDL